MKVVVDWDDDMVVNVKDVEEGINFLRLMVEARAGVKAAQEFEKEIRKAVEVVGKHFKVVGLSVTEDIHYNYVPGVAFEVGDAKIPFDFFEDVRELGDYSLRLPWYFDDEPIFEVYLDI